MKCVRCGEDAAGNIGQGTCADCTRHAAFAELAKSVGLDAYPDPSGERYVYDLDGTCAGKKCECEDFVDRLWDALARSRGRPDLQLGAGD